MLETLTFLNINMKSLLPTSLKTENLPQGCSETLIQKIMKASYSFLEIKSLLFPELKLRTGGIDSSHDSSHKRWPTFLGTLLIQIVTYLICSSGKISLSEK